MKSLIAFPMLTLILASSSFAAAPANRIGMAKARAIVSKLAPGKIVQAELEKEKGAWRYSFDIAEKGRIHEIGVDAVTGKVVEDIYERAGGHD